MRFATSAAARDGLKHCFLAASAYADDDDLAGILSGPGQRGIVGEAGHEASSLAYFFLTGFLSGKNSRDSRSSFRRSGFLVWRNLQRPEAGELVCAVWHRPRGIFQDLPRYEDA